MDTQFVRMVCVTVAAGALASVTEVSVQDAYAQSPEVQQGGTESRTFFRGRPLPECKAFFITEVGYNQQFTNTLARDQAYLFTGDVGYMVNRGRNAWGATWFVGNRVDGFLHGPRLRYGRWLSRGLRLDVSPGVIFTKRDGTGVQGSLALSLRDVVSLTTYVQVGAGDAGLYLGFAIGSHVGLIAGAVGLLGAAASGEFTGWQ